MRKIRINRWLKWLLGISGVLLVLFIAGQLFLYFYFDDILKHFAQEMVRKASKDRYHLEAGRVSYSFSSRSITIHDFELLPDTSRIHALRHRGDSIPRVYFIHIPQLHIDGIEVSKLWHKEALQAESIQADNPDIRIVRNNKWQPQKLNDNAEGFDLSHLVPKPFQGIYLQSLSVHDGSLEMDEEDNSRRKPLIIQHIYTSLRDLAIENRPQDQRKHFYYADKINILIQDYALMLPDSIHKLSLGAMQFDGTNVLLQNIQVAPDSGRLQKAKRPLGLNRIHIPEIHIDSLNIFKALRQNDIVVGKIRIDKPVFALGRPSKSEKGARTQGFNPFLFLPDVYRSLKIASIEMNDGNISFYPNNKATKPISLSPISVQVRNFFIDTLTSAQDKRLLYSDDVHIHVRNFSRVLPGGLSRVQLSSIDMSSAARSLRLEGFRLEPQVGKERLGKILGHQADWASVSIGSIQADGLSPRDLLEDQQLIAQSVTINGFRIYDYRDKRLPEDPKAHPPMPQDMLRQLDYLLNVDKLVLKNAELTYEEFSDGAQKAGVVHFTHINATIRGLSNASWMQDKHYSLTVDAEGQLYGQGKVKAHMVMPMQSPDNSFSLSGTIADLPFNNFNSMVEPAMGVHISDGYIGSIMFDMQGNNDVANGTMVFYYKDLKVNLTDKKTGATNGFKEVLGSLIANNLVIQSDNPKKNQPLRQGSIHFERLKNKAFTNYCWNAILSGIRSSIGVAQVAAKQADKQEKKQDRQAKKAEKKAARKEKREARKAGKDSL